MDDDDDIIEILPSQSPAARIDLYAARTRLARDGIRYDFWGLYCHNEIHRGEFIGMYSGVWIPASDTFEFGNRYAVELSHGMTVAPPGQRPDPRQYPIAMANEPPPNTTANATLQEWTFGAEDVADVPHDDDDARYHGVALVACAHIPRDTEICWYYGPRYAREYTVGRGCRAASDQHPRAALGHLIPRDAVSPMLDSPSNSDDDDPPYGRLAWRSHRLVHQLYQ